MYIAKYLSRAVLVDVHAICKLSFVGLHGHYAIESALKKQSSTYGHYAKDICIFLCICKRLVVK